MKYAVTIAGKTYAVEIDNLNSRPILAKVDGETFTVMPEESGTSASQPTLSQIKPQEPKTSPVTGPAPAPGLGGKTLFAPLPGNVTEIFVRPGQQIETGQVVLIIEAMKMKNSIRSTRAGEISEVLVSAGQTVAHRQPLVNFAEAGEASWM